MEDISHIPLIGWITILVLGVLIVLLCCLAVIVFSRLLKSYTVKTKYFEVTAKEQQKELFIAEGKDQLENQCQVAKQLLKEIRVLLYETSLKTFHIEDRQQMNVAELLTYRIADRLNYEVKNDLTRNHIVKKTNTELEQYTRAKARAYYSLIKDRLYIYNAYLPEFELPKVMEAIPLQTIETTFKDIYFSARRIAGGGKNEN